MSNPARKAEKAAAREAADARYLAYLETVPSFVGFGKIARLNRDIIITEKIDGTNAAIGITEDGKVYAQSRTRVLTPEQDNYGFAAWVWKNAQILKELGPGLHFGEWWGKGINRGYGLDHKRFSLFNTSRWLDDPEGFTIVSKIRRELPELNVVAVLYMGDWVVGNDVGGYCEAYAPRRVAATLKETGSYVAPGFTKPEGIMVYHTKSGVMFKATIENDEVGKEHGA